ncbi:Hint domain-containing protein [Asaia sp. VD9]|uniref:Hint domain-containing protein n=1 Tax=Asaia sp. VD9 TaxID=3081235 RepID=UPI00301A8010
MAYTLSGTWYAVLSGQGTIYTSTVNGQTVSYSGAVVFKGATLTVTSGAVVSAISAVSTQISIASGGILQGSIMSSGGVTIASGGKSISNSYNGGADVTTRYEAYISAGGASYSDTFNGVGTINANEVDSFDVGSGAILQDATMGSGSYVAISDGAQVTGLTIESTVAFVDLGASYGSVPLSAPPPPSYTRMISGTWSAVLNGGQTYYQSGTNSFLQPTGGVCLTGGALYVQSGATVDHVLVQSGQVFVSNGASMRNSTTESGVDTVIRDGGVSTSNVYRGTISGAAGSLSQEDYFVSLNGIFNRIDGTAQDAHIGTQTEAGSLYIASGGNLINPTVAGGRSSVTVQGGMDPSCFLPGALIETVNGYGAVETLRAGDLIAIYDSGERQLAPILSVSRHTHHAHGHKNAADLAGFPVRILADAFAPGVPFQDLLVTGEHCFVFDHALVPVRMLINGGTIRYETEMPSYDYYHVVCAGHHLIQANGTMTETYLDATTVSRVETMPAGRPVDTTRHFVEPLHRALRARAGIMGVGCAPLPEISGTRAQLPCLVTGAGTLIHPLRRAGNRVIFSLPSGLSSAYLRVRAALPSQVFGPFIDDRRLLGVSIGEMNVFHTRGQRAITSHLTCHELTGWHGLGEAASRWTTDLAYLPDLAPAASLQGGLDDVGPSLLSIEILDEGPSVHLLAEDGDAARLVG